ncbi:hypothetical protein A33M_2792 [Rhodovulum sp. PH10]|uniref:DUF1236 domain-containing protein n=1 Tax=Rhodovulum sp. PH10 TaxID=1187851 RepID=UPI00027C27C3|nr:DUF1236 domain-containing protein [Rhodovulum sp. PH10]EJW11809.1 hypothetical protein A33M_2792 [Rhodovulum sp. PH10]
MTRALLLAGAVTVALTAAAGAQSAPTDAGAVPVAPTAVPTEPPPLPAMPTTGGLRPVTTEPAPLTAEQKVAIVRAVKEADRPVKVPPGVDARVGAELPASIELYMLPDLALSTIPEAKPYKYTVVEERVVLVDPTNMRVVEVLAK